MINDEILKMANIGRILSSLGRSAPEILPAAAPAMGSGFKSIMQGFAERALPLAALTGAAYAIPYGITKAKESSDAKRHTKEIDASYEEMFEENKGLADLKQEEGMENAIRKKFAALETFAPDVAKNPLLAGAFIEQAINSGDTGLNPIFLKPSVDLQQARDKRLSGSPDRLGLMGTFPSTLGSLTKAVGIRG